MGKQINKAVQQRRFQVDRWWVTTQLARLNDVAACTVVALHLWRKKSSQNAVMIALNIYGQDCNTHFLLTALRQRSVRQQFYFYW